MKLSYTRTDISIIKNNLYNLIDVIESKNNVSYEIKNIAKEMEAYVHEYDNLIASMDINDTVNALNDYKLYSSLQYVEDAIRKIRLNII